jgi:hypothetical protein
MGAKFQVTCYRHFEYQMLFPFLNIPLTFMIYDVFQKTSKDLALQFSTTFRGG